MVQYSDYVKELIHTGEHKFKKMLGMCNTCLFVKLKSNVTV